MYFTKQPNRCEPLQIFGENYIVRKAKNIAGLVFQWKTSTVTLNDCFTSLLVTNQYYKL